MSMTDRVKPHLHDAGNRQFFTRAGWLTRYALACGYVEIRGDGESGARLEQISSNGMLRVIVTGRWHRSREWAYGGTSLAEARRVFATLDHVGVNIASMIGTSQRGPWFDGYTKE